MNRSTLRLIPSILPLSALANGGWWQIFTHPSLATWSNYDALFQNSGLSTALKTTAYIAVGNTVLVVIIGAMAGYAFAWLDFPGLAGDQWGVYFTGNYYDVAGNTFQRSAIWSINPAVYQGGAGNGNKKVNITWPSGAQAFAASHGDPAFDPEVVTADTVRQWAERTALEATRALDAIATRLPDLPAPLRDEAHSVLEHAQ